MISFEIKINKLLFESIGDDLIPTLHLHEFLKHSNETNEIQF